MEEKYIFVIDENMLPMLTHTLPEEIYGMITNSRIII
jgi:hypothetical protein